MSEFVHATVLLRETVDAVLPRSLGIYVDCTLGGGGHSEALLEASGPEGRVFAVDRDESALAFARARLARFGDRVTTLHGTFSQVPELLREHGIAHVDGLIADLGVSSPQLDKDERGFSFARSGPLDMRMNPKDDQPLSELLAEIDETDLADALYHYGDERKSRQIARSIKQSFDKGELSTTEDLRRAVVRVLGPKTKGADPATRTFQALRMLVNREVEELESLLQAIPDLLKDGARAAIISFHSGEDRLVKHAFRENALLSVVTKKPIEPSAEEEARNPRARSAKLRVAERLPREAES